MTLVDIKDRLKSLGYEAADEDRYLIEFAAEKVTWTIKNECNVDAIPDGLLNVAVDMVCGEVLAAKKSNGRLPGFDAESAVKSIKEGDTQITYAVGDTAAPVDWLVNHLKTYGKAQFATHRRIKW